MHYLTYNVHFVKFKLVDVNYLISTIISELLADAITDAIEVLFYNYSLGPVKEFVCPFHVGQIISSVFG